MGRQAIKIKLEERILKVLEIESRKGKVEKRIHTRIQIILLSNQRNSNVWISNSEKCSTQMIGRWRLKWFESFPTSFDCKGMTDKEIRLYIYKVLSDKKRSGSPKILTESELVRVKSLACEKPEVYDLPFARWTYIELSNQAKRMGINISSSHVERVLKKTNYHLINQHTGYFPKSKMKKNLYQE